MALIHLAVIVALSVVMGLAAREMVSPIRHIGTRLGFSEFVVAMVFLGFTTSLPEISVALFSAAQGTPGLSLGNLIGANVVILTLITGLAAILAKRIGPGELNKGRTLPLLLLMGVLPGLVVLDGTLTRIDGALLVVAHGLFLWNLSQGRVIVEPRPSLLTEKARGTFRMQVVRALVAVAILLASSYVIVQLAVRLSLELGIAPLIVGLMLFALGTNLPELTLVVAQARGRRKQAVFGDLYGSMTLNAPTLGLLGLIAPFTVADRVAVTVSAGFLLSVVLLFGIFMRSKRELDRREGAVLIAVYVVYVIAQGVLAGRG